MTEALEIRLLGPFEAVVDGRQAHVTGSKQEALLAALALDVGRVVTVDTLVDALWGAELPTAPRNALQQHVVRLRTALGHGSIAATAEGYVLAEAGVDALEFEALVTQARAALRDDDARTAADLLDRAVALWRGTALQGLPDSTWATAESRRLETLRVDALEEQFEAALALGEHLELVARIPQALAGSPYRERLWGQLMIALYRSGRQADALETFQEARRVLSDELGLDPGPELQRVQAAILAHDPAVAAVPVSVRRRGNLPAPVTSFVDRERDLADVLALLEGRRLVTLTGPPGVGKSRLALEAARSLEPGVPDGIWLVDLMRADDPADVARLVAEALDAGGGNALERVTGRLRASRAVLVLDGCEHVVEEAARVTSTMLAECPGVRVIATSREVLHLAGEAQLRLAPLDATSAALELFAERAHAARPGLDLTGDADRLVADICRRVDGLPLAIELAAARVNALGLSEIVSSLDRRFALLEGGQRVSEERRALETLVAWSYDLLHTDEKTLLHQLAVHRGGASLPALVAAATQHGLDETTATQLVRALVDKSVVTATFPGGNARYDLLATVREYALERLAESGALDAARRAHAEYFIALADAARDDLRGPGWLASLTRLQLEKDNFWAALAYAREYDPAGALRLGAALGWYFALAQHVSDGRRFLEAAVAAAPEAAPRPLLIELLANLCYLATEEGDLNAAVEAGERALALGASGAAPEETAVAQLTMSLALAQAGDGDRAAGLAAESIRAFESRDDHWGAAAAYLVGAIGAAAAGDVDGVAAATAVVSSHAAAIGYEAFMVPAALLEAWLAERRGDGDGDASEHAYRHALELSERVGFADHASFALAGLGSTAYARGDLDEAAAFLRRALAVAEDASLSWLAALARARLARVLEASGDVEAAQTLSRSASVAGPVSHHGREALFVALADDAAPRA